MGTTLRAAMRGSSASGKHHDVAVQTAPCRGHKEDARQTTAGGIDAAGAQAANARYFVSFSASYLSFDIPRASYRKAAACQIA